MHKWFNECHSHNASNSNASMQHENAFSAAHRFMKHMNENVKTARIYVYKQIYLFIEINIRTLLIKTIIK